MYSQDRNIQDTDCRQAAPPQATTYTLQHKQFKLRDFTVNQNKTPTADKLPRPKRLRIPCSASSSSSHRQPKQNNRDTQDTDRRQAAPTQATTYTLQRKLFKLPPSTEANQSRYSKGTNCKRKLALAEYVHAYAYNRAFPNTHVQRRGRLLKQQGGRNVVRKSAERYCKRDPIYTHRTEIRTPATRYQRSKSKKPKAQTLTKRQLIKPVRIDVKRKKYYVRNIYTCKYTCIRALEYTHITLPHVHIHRYTHEQVYADMTYMCMRTMDYTYASPTYIYKCISTHMQVYAHAAHSRKHTPMRPRHANMHEYTYMYTPRKHTYKYAYMSTDVYTYMYMYARAGTCVHVHVRSPHEHVYTHLPTWTCTHMHLYV